jgi:hypothetical protein
LGNSPDDLKPSEPPTISALDTSGFSFVVKSDTAVGVPKGNPATASFHVEEDDDEWGEMVQSPTTPSGGSGFLEALELSKPAASQDITGPGAPKAVLSSPSQRLRRLDQAVSPGDLEQTTTADSVGDSWDLSFFEGLSTPNSGTLLPIDPAEPASQDLWDAPPVVLGEPPESADDKAIREIIKGLPDLSYMLGWDEGG